MKPHYPERVSDPIRESFRDYCNVAYYVTKSIPPALAQDADRENEYNTFRNNIHDCIASYKDVIYGSSNISVGVLLYLTLDAELSHFIDLALDLKKGVKFDTLATCKRNLASNLKGYLHNNLK